MGDHAMTSVTTKTEGLQLETETAGYLFDNWFDPIESGIRERVRELIDELIRQELDEALARPGYGRRAKAPGERSASRVAGHQHGSRTRSLTGRFGKVELTVTRARLDAGDGSMCAGKSRAWLASHRR